MMTLMGDRFLTSFPSITKTRSLQTCVSTQCVQASTADTPAKYLATLFRLYGLQYRPQEFRPRT
ncbi:hypothetical protein Mp_3g07530 [Marchantia polymorpha subsp. ruderalis]|uniref:Uncharacterized protein n=2 Tax=Marchantia polymorpha TaxID=3197 RepID=A0AAF6AYE3_MARPO|nr:hypothetical protein MARPO_0006s0228 [Marchantia polymorpha]BBN04777.1 hypothetical protein Mp_3g07530 [Marchantia polymorpha subsp. ruderalis]|eukprot:PTQ48221.1 hypothetical protein MARPO_0006s0228 [Marchantia polymorpha]